MYDETSHSEHHLPAIQAPKKLVLKASARYSLAALDCCFCIATMSAADFKEAASSFFFVNSYL